MKLFKRFGLNVSSNLTVSVTNGLNLFTVPRLTCGCGGDIASPQVNANHSWSFTTGLSRDIHNEVDKILSLLSSIQCCTRWALSPQQCNLISTNRQFKLNPSTYQSHTYRLAFFLINKGANIQADRGGSKLVDLLNSFSVTNNSTDSLTNMVSFQSSHFTHWLINQMVKLGSIPAIFTFSYFQYLIASIGKPFHRAVNIATKVREYYQLAFNRDGLSHDSIITHPVQLILTAFITARAVSLSALKCLSFPHPARFYDSNTTTRIAD